MRWLSAMTLCAAAGCAAPEDLPAGIPPAVRARARRKLVDVPRRILAFYYPWYGTPAFGHGWMHWGRVDAKRRDIEASTHYPRAGAYDSHDPAAVDRHARELRRAGVDGIIASWWGKGDYTDRAVPVLLEKAREHGLAVTLYYERVPRPGDPASALEDLRTIVDRYGGHPAFLKVEGRPVVFIYGRALGQLEILQWAEVLTALDREGKGIAAIADAYGEMDALVFDGLHTYNPVGSFRGLAPRGIRPVCAGLYREIVASARARSRIAAATVIPGYDDTKVRSPGLAVDRFGGELYRVNWEEATRSGADWVLITSFNEWHEGSEIEPSAEFGDYFLEATAKYADTFRKSPRAPAKPIETGPPSRIDPERIRRLARRLEGRRIGILGGFDALALELAELGIEVDALRWSDLVTESVTPASHPALLYVGGESYVRTAREEGDVDAALAAYLRAGGALVALPSKPFPFFYDERGRVVSRAGAFGLPICGSGAAEPVPEALRGFEAPPPGETLVFRRNPDAWTILPEEIPYPEHGDLRWRPLVPPPADGPAAYTPIYTLRGLGGKVYGDAAGLLRHRAGPLEGARVLYVALALRQRLARRDLLCLALESVLGDRGP